MKVRTNILIEESILRTAQELGINVSKYCENALRIGIEALKNTQNQIQNQNQKGRYRKRSF
jgi:post-segregation antitoxin (ccd killing protein)